jgi:hypothetical protein
MSADDVITPVPTEDYNNGHTWSVLTPFFAAKILWLVVTQK